MEFGVVLQPNPPASGLIAMMKRAEAGGFGYGWTFDSHVLWQETFVLYPRILESTSTMIVGPMVTNPGTRDWSVIASMFATLNDSFGNRTICGIGRGDSARRYIGLPPVSLSTLSSAMIWPKRGVWVPSDTSNSPTTCRSSVCPVTRLCMGSCCRCREGPTHSMSWRRGRREAAPNLARIQAWHHPGTGRGRDRSPGYL